MKRLQKEMKEFQDKPLDWATVSLLNDNLSSWRVTIVGPEGSPYEKGVFTIDLEIPAEYPFKPPKAKFVTKTYHPNILQKDGSICQEILGANWSPQLKIHEVLLLIREMLNTPNIDSPLEEEVAELFRNNRTKFNATAKEWTKKYAAPTKK